MPDRPHRDQEQDDRAEQPLQEGAEQDRLTTNSNLVGRWIGRSPGFSPLSV